MNLKDLAVIADRVVNEPWGVGDELLASNTESSMPYNRFLHEVVKVYEPKAVVECGVYMATATRHMALACIHTHVIGIDHAFHSEAYNMTYGLFNVHLIDGDTIESAPLVKRLLKEYNRHIGLLFLDSTHNNFTPRMEFSAYEEMFDYECLVCCDDILSPDMAGFWDWLPGDKVMLNQLHPMKYEHLEAFHPGFGVSIIRSK